MAQFYLDKGTWSLANSRNFEFIGMTAGEINRYADATMSWPVIGYYGGARSNEYH